MIKRREIRNRFGLKGDEVDDCIMSACCACCALVQQEKEVVARQHGMGQLQQQHHMQMPMGQAQQGYVPQEQMAVPRKPVGEQM
jgi:PLAC8 family